MRRNSRFGFLPPTANPYSALASQATIGPPLRVFPWTLLSPAHLNRRKRTLRGICSISVCQLPCARGCWNGSSNKASWSRPTDHNMKRILIAFVILAGSATLFCAWRGTASQLRQQAAQAREAWLTRTQLLSQTRMELTKIQEREHDLREALRF